MRAGGALSTCEPSSSAVLSATAPWKTAEGVELATLGWVRWHNHRRLHGYLGDRLPVEYDRAFYAARCDDQQPVGVP